MRSLVAAALTAKTCSTQNTQRKQAKAALKLSSRYGAPAAGEPSATETSSMAERRAVVDLRGGGSCPSA
jgi:hypothetical protein